MHIADLDLTRQSPFNATMHVRDALAGLVQSVPRRTKIAICGAGPGKQLAPTDDPTWEIWSLNASPMVDSQLRFRADRWFDLHEMHAQSEKDLSWIRRCQCPIYLVPQAFDAYPQVLSEHTVVLTTSAITGPITTMACVAPVRYPLEAIEAVYTNYWVCSFAYMIALALYEGASDIGLYGCELPFGTERERTVEYANVSYWLGVTGASGVRIHLPPGSVLGRHAARYGIEYDAEKAAVEQYVTLMRQVDIARKIDKTQPYNSATEDWLLKPERPA